MKTPLYIIIWAFVLATFVSGCSWVEMEHTHGELPDLNLPAIEKVCDHKARIEEEQRGLIIVCEMKI